MTTAINTRLVHLGIGQPRAALVEQGLVSEGLAKEMLATLGKFGWTDAKAKQLRAAIETLQSTMAVQSDQQDDARTAHSGEAAAKADAKALIRKLRQAWPMALRDAGTKAGVAADAVQSGGEIGQSTPKILAYLTTVAPAVKTLEGYLLPYFGGISPGATLTACKAALEKSDSAQENELAQVPAATLAIYEAKGRLLELVTDLNRIGQIAFDGQAETRARFNKDVLLRGHKARAAKPVPA
jgi:hypothetical protein